MLGARALGRRREDIPVYGEWGAPGKGEHVLGTTQPQPCWPHFGGEETEASEWKSDSREAAELAGSAALAPSKKFSTIKVAIFNSMPSSLLGTADLWSQITWVHVRALAPTLHVLWASYLCLTYAICEMDTKMPAP